MREILFKAKRIDNGEWIVGCLINLDDDTFRIATSCLQNEADELLLVCSYEVDQSTICQYTGLTDKNGQKIWENDILKYEWDGEIKIDVIKYEAPMFTYSKSMRWSLYKDEVIGNIFDNPELLNE